MNALQLREKRKEKGLTQKQLAELLCISSNTIINWERGSDEIPELKKTMLENFFNGNTQNSVSVKDDEFTTLIIDKLFSSDKFKEMLEGFIIEKLPTYNDEELQKTIIDLEKYIMEKTKKV